MTSSTLNTDENQVRECLRDAEALKQEGNDHFRGGLWNEALNTYRSALGRLPKRKYLEQSVVSGRDVTGEEEVHVSSKIEETESALDESVLGGAETEIEKECARARAVINSNIGACHVKLGEHKEAVAACTQALVDDPVYIRALQRRAASNDKINSWSSLSAAQDDYINLLELLPPNSPHIAEYTKTLRTLKPRVESSQRAETAEMLDKLKGLGNSILGNFGLSTENFKFTPQSGGGYSMNFQQ